MIDFEITKIGGMASSDSQSVLGRNTSPVSNHVDASPRGYVERLKLQQSESCVKTNNCVTINLQSAPHQSMFASQKKLCSVTDNKLSKEKNGLLNSTNKTPEKSQSSNSLENNNNSLVNKNSNCTNNDAELKKVIQNVNKDLGISKEWTLKTSKLRACLESVVSENGDLKSSREQKSNDTTKIPSTVKNTNVKASSTSSSSSMHLNSALANKTSEVIERTKKPSPLPHSSDELDDMSIDLTEEEEDALLGKNETSDMETDLDLQVEVGAIQSDENGTKEIEISSQEWEVLDEVIASSPEAIDKGKDLDESGSEVSPQKERVSNETKEGTSEEETNEVTLSQETQLAPDDTGSLSGSEISQGSIVEEKAVGKNGDLKNSNNLNENVHKDDHEALCTMENPSLPPVPEEDSSKNEKVLWNFKKEATNKKPDILKEVQFFDNTAKEEGLQQEVDRVVQKILTQIPPEDDTDESIAVQNNSPNNSAVMVKSLTDKPAAEPEVISEKRVPTVQNSKVSHPMSVDEPACDNETNKVQKREILLDIQNQDENVKPDVRSSVFPVSSVVKSSSPVLKISSEADKEELERKRKIKSICDDTKPGELHGLTVKKVKLDTEPMREEMVALKSKLNTPKMEISQSIKPKTETLPRKISQSELEDIVARRMSLYLTENERSEIGSLKLKCEHLEKSLELWRRRATLAQKQTVDLQIALQRMQIAQQNAKKSGTLPVFKVSTRSVGIQVQMHSFLVPDGKMVRGGPTPGGNTTIKMIPAVNSPGQLVNKNSTAEPLAMVNVGKNPSGSTSTLQSMLTKPTLIPTSKISLPSSVHVRPILPNTTTKALLHTLNTMTTKTASSTTITKTSAVHGGVSILQPRITNPQPAVNALGMNQVISSSPSNSTISKVANLTNAPSTVRLDSRRMPTTMSPTGPPVPMRLVPNQAVKQGVTNIRSTPTQISSSNSASSIIDLTSDEDENNVSTTTVHTSGISSNNPSSTTQTLVTTQAVSVSTHKAIGTVSQTSTVTSGQLIINPSPVKNTGPLSVMAAPVRGSLAPALPQAITNVAPGTRLTYLVPSSMVRAQPLYVANPSSRQVQTVTPQNIVGRPPIHTILLQKGTTLVPVGPQGSLTNVQTIAQTQVRNASPNVGLRGVTTVAPTFTTPSMPAITRAPAPPPPPPPLQSMPRPALPTSSTSSAPRMPTAPTYTTVSAGAAEASGQAIVVSRITHKHPAPLPAATNVIENASNLKALPPKPALKISKVNNGIVLSWNMSLNANHSEIASYQLYAYQESDAAPHTSLWKKVGDVKALPLPMACTLTQFMEGHKYHFAVRAVDLHNRIGPFSDPGSIVLNSTPTGIRV